MSLRLVGIQGAKGSGKSTTSRHLQDKYGFVRVSMADPLKRALLAMGATDDEVNDPLQKEQPNELWCGQTNRWAMQSLGTEWGRRLIGGDIWVGCVRRQIDAMLRNDVSPDGVSVVIDDVRFPNEAQMIHDLGGQIWTIRRREVEPSSCKQWLMRNGLVRVHASETHWMTTHWIGTRIDNEGTETTLTKVVDSVIYGTGWFGR